MTVIAIGMNADGQREVLGVDCFTTEDRAGWTALLRGLVARGPKGVALVVSDAHEGLKHAIAAVLPGATWQRCRTHAMRNLLMRVPKSAQAVLAEQHDEWAVARRYMSPEPLTKARLRVIESGTLADGKEVAAELQAVS